MLPESKGEFPKCVYLDQNIWVELEAVNNGDNNDPALKAALAAVKESSRSGSVVFPLSSVHVVETQAWGNDKRRERLAEFMVAISRNYFVKAYPLVLELEIEKAVCEELDNRDVKVNRFPEEVRMSIINKGVRYATNANPLKNAPQRLRKLLEPVIDSPDLTLYYLIDAESKEHVEKDRARAEEGALRLDQVRANALRDLSEEMRWRYELYSFFTEWGITNSVVPKFLDETGVEYGDFIKGFKTREDYVAFLMNVPSAYVAIKLLLEHAKNVSRKTEAADINDTGFLPVVIPYFNAVVTDTYWTHITKACKLDADFDVKVISDLSLLANTIDEICVV